MGLSKLMISDMRSKRREILVAASFVVLVPLLSHLLFSWMGFTPTDEGVTLAYSRRILDGQIAHRDFMITRPFFWPLFHVPVVLWGGSYTFWLSRMVVWFQLGSMSWLWVSMANRLMKFPLALGIRFCLGLIAFTATTHTKHLTAWPTIDGLFFVAMGLALCVRSEQLPRLAGYFLIGVSPFCKQSFAFVAPLSLLILSDWTRVKYWVAAALPAFCYFVYLILFHALPDAFVQLTSRTELVAVGFQRYLDIRILISALAGYICCQVSLRQNSLDRRASNAIVVLVLFWASLLGTAVSLWFAVLMQTSFLLLGLLAGVTIGLLTGPYHLVAQKRIALLALLTAWSASLSLGYNSPALGSGPMLIALLSFVLTNYEIGKSLRFSLLVATTVIAFSFGLARSKYIYREQPASNLNQSLENVLPGGKMIYTNSNTYAFMSDLAGAVEFAQKNNKEYAILPDVAAYWVKSKQQNPLPMVWPVGQEVDKPILLQRFITAMEEKRSSTVFIVQKVEATTLANGFFPLPDSHYYEVVRYARTHFSRIGETKYFELYK
jgi:hypothetical protein